MNHAAGSVSDEVLDAVREDSGLTPAEKETTIGFVKDEERAFVFTAEASLTRRLLAHALFEVDSIALAAGGYTEAVEDIDVSKDTIVGVKGTIPIGCVKIRASRRSSGGHADVVTHSSNSPPQGGENQ